jgi:hypothetical protein
MQGDLIGIIMQQLRLGAAPGQRRKYNGYLKIGMLAIMVVQWKKGSPRIMATKQWKRLGAI